MVGFAPDSSDRISSIHNFNPLFQGVLALALVSDAGLPRRFIEPRAMFGSLVGGYSLDQILSREPDARKIKRSKSVFKWMLGRYSNIECWASPEGVKFIMVTNGLKKDKRRVIRIIPVMKQNGYWFEDDRLELK